MGLLKTDDKELLRDSHSKALLSVNQNELLEYRKKRAAIESEKQKQKTMENKLNQLERDMAEIKNILFSLHDKYLKETNNGN